MRSTRHHKTLSSVGCVFTLLACTSCGGSDISDLEASRVNVVISGAVVDALQCANAELFGETVSGEHVQSISDLITEARARPDYRYTDGRTIRQVLSDIGSDVAECDPLAADAVDRALDTIDG